MFFAVIGALAYLWLFGAIAAAATCHRWPPALREAAGLRDWHHGDCTCPVATRVLANSTLRLAAGVRWVGFLGMAVDGAVRRAYDSRDQGGDGRIP